MKAQSKTDWARVKRAVAEDAPIAYDPAVEPYDPNDEAATNAFWAQATVRLREDIAQGMSDVENGRVKEIDFDRLKQQGAVILQRERLMIIAVLRTH